jgi:hypothetical protein
MMESEMRQEDADEMSPEQIRKLAAYVQAFVTHEKLNVGVCVVVFDRDGYKTIGTVPPEAQAQAFATLHERMRPGGEGPDVMRTLDLKGTNEPTH